MPIEVIVHQKPVLDADDKVGSATIPKTGASTALTFDNNLDYFYTRTGSRGRLVAVGNDVDAGGTSHITFHIHVNGSRIAKIPFDNFTQALGAVYDTNSGRIPPIDLPQGAHIQVVCENNDTTTDYGAYIRLRVEYEDYQ